MISFYLPGNYSPHFTRRELCFSERAVREGINNLPGEAAEQNLRRLCIVLEAIRERWGPWRVTSGYRCTRLNALTPGSSKTSAHVHGCAADGEPVSAVKLVQVMDWLAEGGRMQALGIDQAILEYPPGGWIHVGIAPLPAGPRHGLFVRTAEGYADFLAKWRRKRRAP